MIGKEKSFEEKLQHEIEEIVENLRSGGCCEIGVMAFRKIAYEIKTPQDFKFSMEFAGNLLDSRNGKICPVNAEKHNQWMKDFEEGKKK